MKLKVFACGVLVVVCLSVVVVEGVSQPPNLTTGSVAAPPSPPSPISYSTSSSPTPVPPPKASFAKVDPLLSTSAQQEWTFEQLVEALKGVRARQKELKSQEADLLAKMADKIEEKRKDLAKAEDALQQLKNDSTRTSVSSTLPAPVEKK